MTNPKFNPVNAEYLSNCLSVKTPKELPYHWSFGDQGLLMDALVKKIKVEADCPFRGAKSVNKWIKSLTNEALPALYKAVEDFEENILNMDEVEEEVTYEGKKTTTLELLNRLNLLETMNIRVPKAKSTKEATIDDHYAAQNETLHSVIVFSNMRASHSLNGDETCKFGTSPLFQFSSNFSTIFLFFNIVDIHIN